jgi:hypothetical protein
MEDVLQIDQVDEAAARTRRVTVKNAVRAYGPLSNEHPPILSLEQAAKMALRPKSPSRAKCW